MDPRPADPPIRLVIVDADHRVRESLAALVGSGQDIDVIGTAGHASDAMDLVTAGAPDVVILDPRLPEVDTGLGLIAVLRRRWPDLAILVMSWTEGLETTCLEQGADGFVRKSGGPNELVEAILAVGERRAAAAGAPRRPATSAFPAGPAREAIHRLAGCDRRDSRDRSAAGLGAAPRDSRDRSAAGPESVG